MQRRCTFGLAFDFVDVQTYSLFHILFAATDHTNARRKPVENATSFITPGRSTPNHSTDGVIVDSPSKKTNVSVRLVAFKCKLIYIESVI